MDPWVMLVEGFNFGLGIVLIRHAAHMQSSHFVRFFWGLGAVLGFLREWWVIAFGDLYVYQGFHLTLAGVPLVLLVFWSNCFYLALLGTQWACQVRFPNWRLHWKPLLSIFAWMACCALFTEVIATRLGLVRWQREPLLSLGGYVPVMALWGYGLMGCLFLYAVQGIDRMRISRARRWLMGLVTVPVLIVAQLLCLCLLWSLGKIFLKFTFSMDLPYP